jgi:hypothetical protein
MQRIGSDSSGISSTLSTFGKVHARNAWKGQKTNRGLDNASHQGRGDSPDATFYKPLPLAGSCDRLELNSKAELNLPGSSSAGEATHYSEVAAPEGCPW